MFLKKTALVAASLFMFQIAHADLVTTNNSSTDSTVKILASNVCAGTYGEYTPPHATRDVKWGRVFGLCLGRNPCKANIYNNKKCSGQPVGYAFVDLNTHVVKASTSSPKYSIIVQGVSHVIINGP